MAVQDVVRRRATVHNLRRTNAPVVTGGYAIPSATTLLTASGHSQPFTARQLFNLPEGQRALDWRNFWSLSEVKLRDQVEIDSEWYTVQRVERWPEGDFWHANAVKSIEQL